MTAVPAVIDYLISTFGTAVANLGQGYEYAEPVRVTDGYPGTDQPPYLVTVGSGSDADASTAASRQYVALGAQHLDEEFDVVCYVQAYGSTQKTARDSCFGIFSAVEQSIRNDLTLGGTVKPWPAVVATQTYAQTTPANTASGPWARIEFSVRCKNRY